MHPDYRRFADLEDYVCAEVGPRWRAQGWLSAMDLVAIFSWKSNRAPGYMVKRLLSHGDIDTASRELTTKLAAQPDLRSAFEYFIEVWEFRLPMASAAVTVLRPDEATTDDKRVCDVLNMLESACQFHYLAGETRMDRIWPGYQVDLSTEKGTS